MSSTTSDLGGHGSISLICASANVVLYGKAGSPTGFPWTYDTGVLSRGTAQVGEALLPSPAETACPTAK